MQTQPQHVVDFVEKNINYAKKAENIFDVNYLAILSQLAIESDWGRSYSAKIRLNFSGMIATKYTNEYWSGAKSKSSTSGLDFRIYKTAENSFFDFARLIAKNYVTAKNASTNINLYAKTIAQSAYISEKNGDNRAGYEAGIKSAYARITAYLSEKKKLNI